MSIASAITNAQNKVANCYTAISNKGGTLPQTQDLSNMPTAISSIPTGGTIDSLTITPTTSQQTITASGGTDGYSPITVNAVTSAIDANITAGNIKNGVSILGVTGTYTGGSNIIPSYQISSNTIIPVTNTYTLSGNEFSNVTSIGSYGLYYKFYRCTGLTGSLNFSKVTSVDTYGLAYAFYGDTGITGSINLGKVTTCVNYALQQVFRHCAGVTSVNLSSLETVSGTNGCNYMFSECTGITSIDISALKTVSGNSGCQYMFEGCTGITSVDLSSLETVSSIYGCQYMFNGCTGITSVNISALKTVSSSNGCSFMFSGKSGTNGALTSITFTALDSITGSNSFSYCFRYRKALQNIYFPALKTTSFGTTVNQFANMVNGITGCTIHFPSNLSSTISGLTGYPNFGGTSTVISFDLPATS